MKIHSLRAKPVSPAYGHGGVDTKGPCFVRSGCHHSSPFSPFGISSNDDGLSAVLGVVALFDGRVEGIHIHVKNRAGHFTERTQKMKVGSIQESSKKKSLALDFLFHKKIAKTTKDFLFFLCFLCVLCVLLLKKEELESKFLAVAAVAAQTVRLDET
jgi:hypothetical protein